ncbi:uncharacterized protein K02A2.6-like [Ruditapes philippinarum]|uniref:uncharacterized protein K02A2.6-like n=1 Tax=Ruditapes philippinarum TaxID=129788 RepID=UPI00295B1663|nr:uncharacterized protein K02A2.6-like [Ruditapes philippinarum]
MCPSIVVDKKGDVKLVIGGSGATRIPTSLTLLSQHCKFGEGLNDALRDRLVCGLTNENIQKRLLSEKDLTYERALQLSISMECAQKDVKELHQTAGGAASMHKVTSSFNKTPVQIKKDLIQRECYRCNRKNHTPDACRFKDAICNFCVDDESKKFLTISTHKGLFRYNRLVFGVASAPAIFQRLIEQIMEDIPNVQVILDDMIITGSDDKEHLEILEQVLKRLDEYGLRVNVEKCKFMEPKVEFCGHEIDADGLHKTDAKIAAIVNAPEIKNVKDLRSFFRSSTIQRTFCIPRLPNVGYTISHSTTLRQAVLNELHVGHVGIVKMKSLARSYVYWPGIDTDLESIAQSCSGCMMSKSSPPEAPIHPWEYPSRPWSRVHVDFAGPFMGYMFFVLVDAYSKWPIVKIMQTTTTSKTIEILRSIFADFGICDELVSDNGPQFISDEFQKFLSQNGVKHIRGAPYHPKTNGLAERFVQTFKQALKASKNDSGTLQTKLSRFLMQYRNSEHSTTKETPAKLMFGRTLTTRFDKFRPSLQNRVEKAQSKMVRSTSDRNYLVEDTVMIRDYREKYEKWIPGVIKTQTGPVSYRVEISPGVSWKRHADQIRAADVYPSRLQSQDPNLVVTERPSEIPAEVVKQPTKIPVVPETSANLPVTELRRSSRTIKKPDKLNL